MSEVGLIPPNQDVTTQGLALEELLGEDDHVA